MKVATSLLFILFFQQAEPEFYVSIEEIASPLHYSLYKIEIFRDSTDQYIRLTNYKARTFKKSMDLELYLDVVSKLTRLRVKQLSGDYSPQSSCGYYIVEFRSVNQANRFLVEKSRSKTVTAGDSLLIIRLMKNAADLTLSDMRSR